jgi:hypothetical protein
MHNTIAATGPLGFQIPDAARALGQPYAHKAPTAPGPFLISVSARLGAGNLPNDGFFLGESGIDEENPRHNEQNRRF